MIKRILIGVVALLVLAAIVGGGAYLWKNWQKSKESKAPQTEVKLPVTAGGEKQGGELAANLAPEPETDSFLNETGLQAKATGSRGTTAPSKSTPVPPKGTPAPKKPTTGAQAPGEGEVGPEPEDMAGDLSGPATGAVAATGTPKEQRVAPPVTGQTTGQPPARTTPKPGTRAEVPLAATPTAETLAIEPILEPTPTPTPTMSTTPTPTPTPIPSLHLPTPVPGTYNVRTLQPVWETQLAVVRNAMKSLGVVLQEQKAGRQELAAYRIAVGYFQAKEEAESWAQYNFRPRGIKYYVYPTQGMFSLQIGIYTQQQNIEPAMREFYRRYEGGRLPIREEMTTIAKTAYQLSISQITKSLAEKVWDQLARLGIQAEISGL